MKEKEVVRVFSPYKTAYLLKQGIRYERVEVDSENSVSFIFVVNDELEAALIKFTTDPAIKKFVNAVRKVKELIREHKRPETGIVNAREDERIYDRL